MLGDLTRGKGGKGGSVTTLRHGGPRRRSVLFVPLAAARPFAKAESMVYGSRTGVHTGEVNNTSSGRNMDHGRASNN